jgi:hypothetical protein
MPERFKVAGQGKWKALQVLEEPRLINLPDLTSSQCTFTLRKNP